MAIEDTARALRGEPHLKFPAQVWPLPNVWLGVSAERQREWDDRKWHLKNTPAAVRFASFEPLLGEIIEPNIADYIHWAIDGGESGHQARGCLRSSFRTIRDQCDADGVAYFHKQNGEWIDADEWLAKSKVQIEGRPWDSNVLLNFEQAARLAKVGGYRCEHQSDGTTLIRVGKKAAGRLLDGREHNDFPKVSG